MLPLLFNLGALYWFGGMAPTVAHQRSKYGISDITPSVEYFCMKGILLDKLFVDWFQIVG